MDITDDGLIEEPCHSEQQKYPLILRFFFNPAFPTLQSANQQVWQANCKEITQQHEYMHFSPTPYVNYEKVFSVGFRI